MITLEMLENFVKKFPELELKSSTLGVSYPHYYAVLKEKQDCMVFTFHNHSNTNKPYVFLNQDIPLRINIDGYFTTIGGLDKPYGSGYYDLEELEMPLKKVIYMYEQLLFVQKKIKMYEKNLMAETDFN